MKPTTLQRIMNLWLPFLGAGINVESISDDHRKAVVTMKLRWYNRNYVKAHFGGSLYAMTDPFFMLLMMENLGKRYIVWDQWGSIEYVKPGKGKVSATFEITQAMVDEAIEKTKNGDKFLPDYKVHVLDEANEIVAIVHKRLYIRLKRRNRPA